VAQRLLAGEVLHRDVQDVHPGYINFLNAAALRLFGLDLLGLRYPLVAAGFVQSLLVFLLLGRRRPGLALVASVALTALGVLQFLNPTAHWYCLALAIAIAAALAWLPREGRARLLVVGALLGTLALFRQLSGALVAAGALSHLLIEARTDARGRDAWLGPALLLGMMGGLAFYLARATGAAGWLLFGVWPLLLLAGAWRTAGAGNRAVLRIVGLLGAGAALAALPLVLYHLVHGSLGWWLHDTVGTALGLGRMGFLERPFFAWLVRAGFLQLFSGRPVETINGIYWLALPLLAAVNGLLVLALLRSRETPHPLCWLAVFYAPVSVHYQIPIYLAYSAGLSLVSLLFHCARSPGWISRVGTAAAAVLAVIAVRFQAGQPLSRGLAGMLRGERVALVPAELPRARLLVEPEQRQRYRELIDTIERETGPDQTILAVPSDAELYFLSGRRNPTRFYNTALGITDEGTFAATARLLREHPPALVLFNAEDKYNTTFSTRLMQVIRERHTLLRRIHGFDIYRLP
jgi:hypothetical protein